jgi:hypothetical protein
MIVKPLKNKFSSRCLFSDTAIAYGSCIVNIMLQCGVSLFHLVCRLYSKYLNGSGGKKHAVSRREMSAGNVEGGIGKRAMAGRAPRNGQQRGARR